MDLDKIVWTATVSGGSNPERTKSEMLGTDDRQIMISSFSWNKHIFMMFNFHLFWCWKSPPVYPSPERPDPGEHGDEAVDQQHPGLVHRAVGGQHHDPRDEHDQPGGQMFHTKWLTWVVVRTNTDKTSKGSPCDEEGSPCQSLPLGNSGSCQVLQPLGIATTHLVWNIFNTISRNCKKHLSVVFKYDFSKLLKPIFLKYLSRDFQYFNRMAIRLIDSWFWSLFGFF